MKTNVLAPFWLAAILVLGIGLACTVNLTDTPTPLPPPPPTSMMVLQPTNSPPQLPMPTNPPPTAIPTQATVSQYFTEEWDNGMGAWVQQVELNRSDGSLGQAKLSVDSGRLRFDLGKWLIAYVFYPSFTYENVRLDVRVDNRGTNINNILLVCRKSEEGHYLVNIANSGLFAMYAYDGTRGSYARIADGGSNRIKQGKDVNEYTLICFGRTLTLYINGEDTRSYTDNQYTLHAGQVGVGVASEGQLPVKVEFDWVKISEP